MNILQLPTNKKQQTQIDYLEEGEILVAVEDKDRQVIVHVEHLRRNVDCG